MKTVKLEKWLRQSQTLLLPIVILIAGVVGCWLWWRLTRLRPAVAPLPQDPYIQVFFNQSRASVYTDPYRRQQRYGDDLEHVILSAIASASTSIDVAVQELNLPRVAQALRAKAQAGVRVRVVLENSYNRPWSDYDPQWIAQQDDYSRGKYENLFALGDQNRDGRISEAEAAERDALVILQAAAIPTIDDTADGTKGSGLMHHKFMVVDDRWVVTGSANWTVSDTHGDPLLMESRGNANALLRIDSPSLAQRYTNEFSLMWGDGPGGKADSRFGSPKPARAPQRVELPGSSVLVQFSPHRADTPWNQTVNGLIAQSLQQATRRIDLALFVFTEQGIVNLLAMEVQSGVALRALVDRSFVYRSYSEALDMLGMALPGPNCNYEKNNHPWSTPITTVGYPDLPEGDKLHHKFALLDDSIVIIGSHNWSKAANHTNDENLLVIQNPTVAKHFQREFERLYENAQVGNTPYLQHQVAKLRQKCGG
jgi:phosphatidylserine/phosphatidylglycerophosphate/cardiolipin synthase-like enzyme